MAIYVVCTLGVGLPNIKTFNIGYKKKVWTDNSYSYKILTVKFQTFDCKADIGNSFLRRIVWLCNIFWENN